MEPVTTIDYKNYTINISFDHDPESPRTWDNLGSMACRHRNYELGDIQIPEYWIDDNSDMESTSIDSMDEVKRWIEGTYGELAVILPLSLYDHSGISISVGSPKDRWDSGYVGFVFVTKERVIKEYGEFNEETRGKVEEVLRSEVDIYDKYLTGQVFSYEVEDENGNHIDSRCGLYEEEQAIKEAKQYIDYDIEKRQREKEKKLKQYIKANVPVQYRFI